MVTEKEARAIAAAAVDDALGEMSRQMGGAHPATDQIFREARGAGRRRATHGPIVFARPQLQSTHTIYRRTFMDVLGIGADVDSDRRW